MKVSIVIPAYNEEQYIGRCLESVKRQTDDPYEVIVVDNNCTDRTAYIARQYKATVIPEAKQGMISARNAGYDFASGDLIARTDADAVLPSGWIQSIKDIWQKKPFGALSGPITYYDLPFHTPFYSKILFSTFHMLKKYYPLLGPNCIIEKTMWQKVRPFVCLSEREVHEDIDLAIHIAEQGGVIEYDPSLLVKVSGRRIIKKPDSFFFEYAVRYVQMLVRHRHTANA